MCARKGQFTKGAADASTASPLPPSSASFRARWEGKGAIVCKIPFIMPLAGGFLGNFVSVNALLRRFYWIAVDVKVRWRNSCSQMGNTWVHFNSFQMIFGAREGIKAIKSHLLESGMEMCSFRDRQCATWNWYSWSEGCLGSRRLFWYAGRCLFIANLLNKHYVLLHNTPCPLLDWIFQSCKNLCKSRTVYWPQVYAEIFK